MCRLGQERGATFLTQKPGWEEIATLRTCPFAHSSFSGVTSGRMRAMRTGKWQARESLALEEPSRDDCYGVWQQRGSGSEQRSDGGGHMVSGSESSREGWARLKEVPNCPNSENLPLANPVRSSTGCRKRIPMGTIIPINFKKRDLGSSL